MSDAVSRLTAYLDEMDRINAGASITYGDIVHGMNDLPLNRSDIHAVLAELRAVEAAVRADQAVECNNARFELLRELAAAQAVIAHVRETALSTGDRSSVLLAIIRELLSQSLTDALQAHDRQVAAKAWDEGEDAGAENQGNWDGWRYTKPQIVNPYRTQSGASNG